jgi:membrane protein
MPGSWVQRVLHKPKPPRRREPASQEAGPPPARWSRARWRTVAVRLWDRVGDVHIDLLAAGVALFAILSLMPAIAATVSIYGAVADPGDVQRQLRPMARLVPPDVVQVVGSQLARMSREGGSLGLGFALSLGFALVSAMSGVRALMKGINMVNQRTERRSWWLQTALAFALSVGGIATAAVAVGLLVVLPTALQLVHLDAQTELIVTLGRWPALFALMMAGVAILYWISPVRPVRHILPGAALATSLWLLGSLLLSLYVDHVANYNGLYGAFGGLMVLLLWFYVSAFVVLLGAAFNHELEQSRPSVPV